MPIIEYRLLWGLTGIRSYGAYLLVLVVVHLVTATLLRSIMLRANVGPWLATAFAVVFVFLGSGSANIVIVFQVTFAGSLMFGFVELLLAMHQGPIGRRDDFAARVRYAALMCSGLGLAMLVGVGIAVLLRRGWRIVFGAHCAAGRCVSGLVRGDRARRTCPLPPASPRRERFASRCRGSKPAFSGLGRLNGIGLLYFVMLGAGVALRFVHRRGAPVSDGVASALGLLVAALFFVGSTAAIREVRTSPECRARLS